MKKNGFTTIELMVVVVVIGALIGIVIANYPAIKRQLALNRAAHQLIQDIRRAQEMAMSATQFKSSDAESCSLPMHFSAIKEAGLGGQIAQSGPFTQLEGEPLAKGYGIYINISENNESYILYADTQADSGVDCETPGTPCWEYYNFGDCIYKTIAIQEQEIIIKEINNISPPGGESKVSINFRPPNPNTKIKWLESNENEVEIVLAIKTDQDKTKTIIVNRAGLIEVR